MSVDYGSQRSVTGAHYGLRDWLVQRASGALIALWVLIVISRLCLSTGPVSYENWAGIFSAYWMRAFTFAVVIALAWHAFIGMRDIWMDYVKPVGLRLVLHVFTAVWLVGCTGWAIQALWRL